MKKYTWKRKTEATKQAAAKMVYDGTPVVRVTKNYGVSENSIRAWMKKYPRSFFLKSVKINVPASPDPQSYTSAALPPSCFTPTAKAPQELHVHLPPDFGKIHAALTTLKEAGLF